MKYSLPATKSMIHSKTIRQSKRFRQRGLIILHVSDQVVTFTNQYPGGEYFRGKNVVCVGIGETGADIASHIAENARACTLSIRRYIPIVKREPLNRGYTNDVYTCRALYKLSHSALDKSFHKLAERTLKKSKDPAERIIAQWTINAHGNHSQFQTKTDGFVHQVVKGELKLNTSGIRCLDANHVYFNDGQKVACDTLVLNTGYKLSFPFSQDCTINNMRDLYKHMIHPELGKQIVFIGWARPAVGGVPACSELQARYFALLLSGKKQLSTQHKLLWYIAHDRAKEEQRFYLNPRLKTLVHYSGFTEELAGLIGCRPNKSLLLAQPYLFYKYWFGAQLACQYRLNGPHAKPEQAIANLKQLPIGYKISEMGLMTSLAIASNLDFRSK